jgi:hypothetical protein
MLASIFSPAHFMLRKPVLPEAVTQLSLFTLKAECGGCLGILDELALITNPVRLLAYDCEGFLSNTIYHKHTAAYIVLQHQ